MTTAISFKTSYTITNIIENGYQINIKITNPTQNIIDGWICTFQLPTNVKVLSAWNTFLTTNGTTVTAKNVSYNTIINPFESVFFGLKVIKPNLATPTIYNLKATNNILTPEPKSFIKLIYDFFGISGN